MRSVAMTVGRSRSLVVGLFVLGLGIGAGLALTAFLVLTFGPRGASATHAGTDTVHACVGRYTGQARIMLPGQVPNCTPTEQLVDLAGGAAASDPVYTVRETSNIVQANTIGSAGALALCQAGETAISGGYRVETLGQQGFATNISFDSDFEPFGSPPTGWFVSFRWTATPTEHVVITSVLCVA